MDNIVQVDFVLQFVLFNCITIAAGMLFAMFLQSVPYAKPITLGNIRPDHGPANGAEQALEKNAKAVLSAQPNAR